MKLSDALQLPSLAGARVVAGAASLDRTIRWVPVVDVPDPVPWVQQGDFMLTTGYSWPRDEEAQRELLRKLAGKGLSGLGFAVPNFFDRIPEGLIETAESLQLALIEIPWETPFSAITEEIHGAIIAAQYELIEKSGAFHRELMNAALEAASLQDIAARLGHLLAKPLVIAQPDGAVIARSPDASGQDPAPLFEKLLHDHPGMLRATRGNRLIRLREDKGPAAARLWPIRIKKEQVGFLCIFENGNAPLTELEGRTAEYATLILALHLSWQRQLASLESQLGYSFLESLKEGAAEPTLQMAERAKILGFDPKAAYRTGLIAMDLPLPLSREGFLKRERLAARLRAALAERGARPLISAAQNQLTFLLPQGLNAQQIWDALQDEPRLVMAVSRPHTGFAGVRQGYLETAAMLAHLAPGQWAEYEDLLVPRLLLGEEEARRAFLDKMFQKLREARNGDVLTETLIAAARHNFQLKKTARHLNIHPKTLRYRLDRAVAITGFDLEDPETQFQLQLAARIAGLAGPAR